MSTRLLTATDWPWIVAWMEAEQLPAMPGLQQAIATGQVVGGWRGETYLGLGGCAATYWSGVWHVWLTPALGCLACPRYAVWTMRTLLHEWKRTRHVRRFQTLAKADWPEACRLVEILGFHAEGCMEELLPGEAYTMYAKLYKDEAHG